MMKSSLPLGTIAQGDALEVMRGWPTASVQCCITSIPYWQLRDYQVEGVSLKGQYGQEATIEEWIAVQVEVFGEVRRVLRKDGTLWLNCGDKYAGRAYKAHSSASDVKGWSVEDRAQDGGGIPAGFKAKDLLMLPARLAIALQADGWTLRSDIIWSKPNPMPESVTDRPATAHEHVFLLTPGPKYYYDAEAVRERAAEPDRERADRIGGATGHTVRHSLGGLMGASSGRNLRNVWEIATQPYAGAHYATFPEALVQPCIAAGTSERGACPACGAPWRRVVEKSGGTIGTDWRAGQPRYETARNKPAMEDGTYNVKTTGWEPGCECQAPTYLGRRPLPPVPCTVMDPFAGSGTVGVVAYKMGREFVGIDLAGGDADMGGHTAHDRITAAREGGRSVAEHIGHREAGQMDMLGGGA